MGEGVRIISPFLSSRKEVGKAPLVSCKCRSYSTYLGARTINVAGLFARDESTTNITVPSESVFAIRGAMSLASIETFAPFPIFSTVSESSNRT